MNNLVNKTSMKDKLESFLNRACQAAAAEEEEEEVEIEEEEEAEEQEEEKEDPL